MTVISERKTNLSNGVSFKILYRSSHSNGPRCNRGTLTLLRYWLVEGSLEVKLPTIWTDEKQSREEAERRERSEGKKMEMREKVGKSRNCVFPIICGSGGSKSRLAKAAGAEPAGQMNDEKLHAVVARSRFPKSKHTIVGPLLEVEMSKKCTPLWREAHLQVKM